MVYKRHSNSKCKYMNKLTNVKTIKNIYIHILGFNYGVISYQ